MSKPSKTIPRDKLRAYLLDGIHDLEDQHDFRYDTGWAQVEGKPIEIIVAYGEFDGLIRVMDDFELWDGGKP